MLDSLKQELNSCQLADVHRLRQTMNRLERSKHQGTGEASSLKTLKADIIKSQKACDRRRRAIPKTLSYPENLPVTARVPEIAELIARHQVLIVAGDTGSGKTTQLPKICLQAGFGVRGLIGHTQPRRLAAISVANRIAEELGTETGLGVGSQVRFSDNSSDQSYLKLMTDGILLAEIQQDKLLNKYEILIIDEAHERSLNIDFLLGFLKQLVKRRPELKLIVTSATIDVEKFSAHFDNAPVVAVSGRTYPVETRYAPLDNSANNQPDDESQLNGISKALREIVQSDLQRGESSGDVLVFLSSEREIRETASRLRKQKLKGTEIFPLYGRLPYSEQARIFKPGRGRKIVLATNVAETSITVPGINYVIDTGLARISRYSLQSKVQRLPIEAISQASAKQRQGRCGRMANGVCLRLYSESDFESRPHFTDPEIIRTNLASVILRMKYLKLGNIEEFPFLDTPEQKAINEGIKLLIELDALNHSRQLTEVGRKMAVLPVDPKYARMLIVAQSRGCLRELLIIVSALSIQDPREISSANRQQALQKLAEFNNPDSDFLGLVKLWDDYELKRQSLSQGQLRKHCKDYFLAFMRMREWREVHHQLVLACQHLGLRINQQEGSYAAIHKSLISGSLNQVARRLKSRNYRGSRNKTFTLLSSSVLAAGGATWIVSGDQIETSQTFATQAAKIEPEWIVEMALHLVKREYFEPHWSKQRQQVMAYEKVQLYGLVIIEKALLSYRKIDPAICRELFVREGLVGAQLASDFAFYRKNEEFLAALSKQEEKMRKPDLLVNERDIEAFYRQRLPDDICTTRDLSAWLRKGGKKIEDLLVMSVEKLTGSSASLDATQAFPDKTAVHKNSLNLDYVFEPGNRADGATLEVPLAVINQLQQSDLDWAVPGSIVEKCTALIKGLPKSLRKTFIPVNAFVEQARQQMSSGDGDLIDSLLRQIRQLKGVHLKKQVFQQIQLPNHLNTKIRVLNEQAAEIVFADNLEQAKAQLREKGFGEDIETAATVGDGGHKSAGNSGYNHPLEVAGLEDWTIAELPEQLEVGDPLKLIRYPALVDEGDSVRVCLYPDRAVASNSHLKGLVKLFQLRSIQQRNQLRKKYARLADALVLKAPFPMTNFPKEALWVSYVAAFDLEQGTPRCKSEFDKVLTQGKSQLLGIADKIESLFVRAVDEHFNITGSLQGLKTGSLCYLEKDVRGQLNRLLHENFLSETGLIWFTEYPRYLKAIRWRLAKAPHMGDKDRSTTEMLGQYQSRYLSLAANISDSDNSELLILRWMLEEFRVSLFAQSLGTRLAVSTKRIDKQFDKLLSGNQNKRGS